LLQSQLTIVNRLGLHARAASKFVNCAKSYGSDVRLSHKGQDVDGKSIMGVMLLAAPVGSEIGLAVAGEDEGEAFAALVALVNDGFGELGKPE
jgi:phosphocarrier protein